MRKLDDVEVKEKYWVEIENRVAALESLDESFDIILGTLLEKPSRPQPKII
jgi:hypothetical protein